jgi:polar amino acid transport system substrate-binding protein
MPMTMKNRIFRTAGIISILLIASIVFSSCSKTDDDKLVVGMELAYPPFETTDKDNKPPGISVDLL